MSVNKEIKILVVDDEKIIREGIFDYLNDEGFSVEIADRPSQALNFIRKDRFDIVILDNKLPEMSGLELLPLVKKNNPGAEVIVITGHGDKKTLLECLRKGAYDYFSKPFKVSEIKSSIERTSRYINLSKKSLRRRDMIHETVKERRDLFLGKSKEIKDVLFYAKKAAGYESANILITGPSGTGKEVIARIVHQESSRRSKIFFPLNCSAIPDTLVESEFFGHKKGAFTGAVTDSPGCFESANGGSLFLDEIGDMSLSAQAKILRVLEDRRVKRIGDNKEIPVDVRLISATNKNIENMITQELFRSDLYYRINSFEIYIPPLKDRKEDIVPLVEYFFNHYVKVFNKNVKTIHPDVYRLLEQYDFPGNVRELRNQVERAVILCDRRELMDFDFHILYDIIKVQDGKKTDNGNMSGKVSVDSDSPDTGSDENDFLSSSVLNQKLTMFQVPAEELTGKYNLLFHRLALTEKAMVEAGYSKIKAAKLLGISRYQLTRLLKKYHFKTSL